MAKLIMQKSMLKKAFTIVTSLILASFIFAISTKAATLFEDNFSSGNNDKWTTSGNAGWSVQNNEYGIRLEPGLSNTTPNDQNWNYGWTQITYEVDLRGEAGVDKNILLKFKDSSNFIEVHANDNGIFLDKASSFGGVNLGFIDTLLQNGITYHFKSEINNEKIKVYLDDLLIFDVTENFPLLTNWKVGLRAGTGAVSPTEVWFDNVVVSDLATSTPTPTSTPIPSPEPIVGKFELPFSYPGRVSSDSSAFKNAFWSRLTAAFDHEFASNIFKPFTGSLYSSSDCPTGTFGIVCYDSHNGTDFSQLGGTSVYSVATGKVVYATPHDSTSCTPDNGGFGCVVIAQYPGNKYGLYAHLNQIDVVKNTQLTPLTRMGTMGETGCPGCGTHLHFGVMKPTNAVKAENMTNSDWKSFLSQIAPHSKSYPAFCNYIAPDGNVFTFLDPSGWKGQEKDPWSINKKKEGCGIHSNYLWKFDVGTSAI